MSFPLAVQDMYYVRSFVARENLRKAFTSEEHSCSVVFSEQSFFVFMLVVGEVQALAVACFPPVSMSSLRQCDVAPA